MIFTDLAYLEVGRLFAMGMGGMLVGITIFRLGRCFHHYINNGDFGSYKNTWLVQLVEEGKPFSPYLFTGCHPFGFVDIAIFGLFSFAAIALWGGYVVVGLTILLAKVMRKRIGAKQEFVSRLEGTYE